MAFCSCSSTASGKPLLVACVAAGLGNDDGGIQEAVGLMEEGAGVVRLGDDTVEGIGRVRRGQR